VKQAIITRTIPPTNLKGTRVKAFCNGDREGVILPFDDEISAEENHEKVARVLLHKLKWGDRNDIVGGSGNISRLHYCFWVLIPLK
jgi:hypothetical protein